MQTFFRRNINYSKWIKQSNSKNTIYKFIPVEYK